MPPGRLEFLQLKSAFASIGSVDCGQVNLEQRIGQPKINDLF
jgi:hypothetical protein